MKTLAVVLVFAATAMSQTSRTAQGRTPSKEELSKLRASMPSQEEFSELLAKANEKVSNFEAAVRNAKPYLDKIDVKYATNYLDAASTAHTLIQATNKNGPSAYRLVGVLATLDDLSYDAASGSVFLLAADENRVENGESPDMNTQGAVIALDTAGTACNDISELIFHSTMRFVAVEDKLLELLIPN